VLLIGIPIGVIVGMAIGHRKLATRISPKRAEWIMVGMICTVPFILAGLILGFGFIADAIHGPYG
jgi:CDP-diglyceride synthetase